MIDAHVNNPKSIKYHVKAYFSSIQKELKNKVVVDVPAGNGATSEILSNLGADVKAFDLFPEYFMLKNIPCQRADVMNKLPLQDAAADMLICQEGIEHFSDQLKVFKEFNRVLKPGGELIITTPSYSNLAAKLNYLLFESEERQQMPPNEIDDLWMSDKSLTNETYYGHIFLLGLQKLRILGKLAGFKIKEIRFVRKSKGSIFLLPLFYPFILIRSYKAYYGSLKRNENISLARKKEVYGEQLKININYKNLINRHIFIIFEKESDGKNRNYKIDEMVKPFGKIM
jgi:ubiquinone/menaquinone biosynthesis C-methylase UbiE